MAYKVIDIYRDLPRTNCGDCGRGSCFAFASAVYLEAFPLENCPHLEPDRHRTMEEKLAQGREGGEGRKPASSEQALQALRATVAGADLATQAERCGGTLTADGRGVALRFLDSGYLASRDDVVADTGDEPTIWVKIFLLIYLTRASGRSPAGEWVAYRELPNTVSKSTSFEACAARIAVQFEGDPAGLAKAVASLGGEPHRFGSADGCFRFQVLPRVPLLLLFWDREEEFPARVSLLLDRHVLDYLDQEAIVFLAEAFASRLLGKDLNGVVA
ncbi:MAG TPA: DUF3786 domain-containing protein [Deferrisomatales bacterium]|nr:DUF3786 domain-containing protein [Deferrisomatales bacterium]